MKNINSFLSLLALLFCLTTAQARPNDFLEPNSQASNCLPCLLEAPRDFNLVSAGTTWVTVNWTAVHHAHSYVIRTFLISTNGNQLFNTRVIPGNETQATIYGLASGENYHLEISCICEETGSESPNNNFIDVKTIILDLVISQYTLPQYPAICTLGGSNGSQFCTFPLIPNVSINHFKITNGFNTRYFAISKTLTEDRIRFRILGANTPPYNFHGGGPNGNYAPPPNYLGASQVTFQYNQNIIANIVVEDLGNGQGQLSILGNLAGGYTVQRLAAEESNGDSGEYFSINPSSNTTKFTAHPSQLLPADRNTGTEKSITMANPFTNQLTIRLKASDEELVTLQLYDLQGRLLKTQEGAGGEESYTIDTQDIIPGMYLLRIEIGAFLTVVKVVKT